MAGVNTDSPGKEAGKGKKGPKGRLRVWLDMTPMVDIAFLLLIFYMVTTVFAAPRAMEINLPAETGPIDMPRSNILVIRVDSSGTYWWSMGDAGENLYKIEKKNLSDSLVSANRHNMLLSTLVKIHPRAEFSDYVNIIDEIARTESILQNDREYIEDYLVKNTEALGPEKFTDTAFSYRYTLDSWHPAKDDITIQQAIKSRQALKERRRP
ncbi:MAG TPA: biopolymer transporter ExbD [candidate division Zixibacteria bacterium]|nr:biopolymer transporter ExbD [candidate division Zixibacteria bacterium]